MTGDCECLGIVDGFNEVGETAEEFAYGSYCSDDWDFDEPAWCYVDPKCKGSVPTKTKGWQDKISWIYCDEVSQDSEVVRKKVG